MKTKMDLLQMPVVLTPQAARESVVTMARQGQGARRIARSLGIDEADVLGYLLNHAECRFRQGRERGKLSAMPNLPGGLAA